MGCGEHMREGATLIESLAAAGRISADEAEGLRLALRSARDAGEARFGAALSWAAAVLAAFMFCSQAAATFRLPLFARMFEEMGIKEGLPFSTELLLAIPWWLQAAVLGGLAAATLLKEHLLRSRGLRVALSVGVIALLMLYGSFVSWALFAPMITMMQQLTQQV